MGWVVVQLSAKVLGSPMLGMVGEQEEGCVAGEGGGKATLSVAWLAVGALCGRGREGPRSGP